MSGRPSGTDPVRERRARIDRLAAAGRRAGYGLVLVAIAAFAVGVVAGFTRPVTSVVTASQALTTLTLAPSLVAGYAVKAAEREDRAQGR